MQLQFGQRETVTCWSRFYHQADVLELFAHQNR